MTPTNLHPGAPKGGSTAPRGVLPCLVLALIAAWAGPALAGGGAEGVLLVVNANSPNSLEVANHYARLREIPACNVLHLDYQGNREWISGDQFRDWILKPLLQEINQRGLATQIDTIAYSCDFPWKIRMQGDFPEDAQIPKVNKPTASLTGATYLWQLTLGKNPAALSLVSNFYVPGANGRNLSSCQDLGQVTSRGFRGRYTWRPGGKLAEESTKGLRYFLSTMLGVTTGRGNTVEEVVESLKRSTYAELSPPQGEFLFATNTDVRSKTRHACYDGAVRLLRGLGAEARVLEGTLPSSTKLALGVTAGAAKLDFDKAQLKIAQGAICEHLTSSGGDLRTLAGQTPISAWIRAGASGASGTVDEPYAVQAKFPLPTLQVHYRRGCSLAESFYQSVQSPYQLLVLGDPLCQPWAQRPGLEAPGWPGSSDSSGDLASDPLMPPVSALEIALPEQATKQADKSDRKPTERETADTAADPDAELSEATEAPRFSFTPRVIATAGQGALFWELFVDGRLRMRLPSGTTLRVRDQDLGPGWHELRCVASNPDPVEARRQLTAMVEVDRRGPEGETLGQVSLASKSLALTQGEPARFIGAAEGAELIEIFHHARQVGEIQGPKGEVTLDPALLGRGPVRLHAVSRPDGARSKPIWLIVN